MLVSCYITCYIMRTPKEAIAAPQVPMPDNFYVFRWYIHAYIQEAPFMHVLNAMSMHRLDAILMHILHPISMHIWDDVLMRTFNVIFMRC